MGLKSDFAPFRSRSGARLRTRGGRSVLAHCRRRRVSGVGFIATRGKRLVHRSFGRTGGCRIVVMRDTVIETKAGQPESRRVARTNRCATAQRNVRERILHGERAHRMLLVRLAETAPGKSRV